MKFYFLIITLGYLPTLFGGNFDEQQTQKLYSAILKRSIVEAKIALDANANQNAKFNGHSLLYSAVQSQKFGILRQLIFHGAEITTKELQLAKEIALNTFNKRELIRRHNLAEVMLEEMNKDARFHRSLKRCLSLEEAKAVKIQAWLKGIKLMELINADNFEAAHHFISYDTIKVWHPKTKDHPIHRIMKKNASTEEVDPAVKKLLEKLYEKDLCDIMLYLFNEEAETALEVAQKTNKSLYNYLLYLKIKKIIRKCRQEDIPLSGLPKFEQGKIVRLIARGADIDTMNPETNCSLRTLFLREDNLIYINSYLAEPNNDYKLLPDDYMSTGSETESCFISDHFTREHTEGSNTELP